MSSSSRSTPEEENHPKDVENLVERLGTLKDGLEEFTRQAMDTTMPEQDMETMLDTFQAYAASKILEFAPREGDILPDFVCGRDGWKNCL
jgi:hypothetical protein